MPSQEEVREYCEDLIKGSAKFDAATANKNAALLGAEHVDQVDNKEIEDAKAKVLQICRPIERNDSLVKPFCEAEKLLVEDLLRIVEEALVEKGLLRSQQGGEVEEPEHTQPDGYKSKPASSKARHQSPSSSQHEGDGEQQRDHSQEQRPNLDEYRPNYDTPPRRERSPPLEPRAPAEARNIVQDVQKDYVHALRKAKDARANASLVFDQVRHKYYENLEEFLKEKQQKTVNGTRSDFDRTYFLQRNKATTSSRGRKTTTTGHLRKQIMPRSSQLATGVSIWAISITMMLFSEEIDLDNDPIWKEQAKDILSWKRGISQDISPDEDAEERAMSGWSMDGLEEFELRQSLATGKRRKQIEFWGFEQERMRRDLPDMGVVKGLSEQAKTWEWDEQS